MALPFTKQWRDERWFKDKFFEMLELSNSETGWKAVPLESLGAFGGKPEQNLSAILGRLPTQYEDAARAYLNHDGLAGPMDALAQSAASVPIKYYDARSADRGPGDWSESQSPLAQSLRRINPLSTASPLTHYATTYYHLFLAGDAYWYFEKSGYVFNLRPDRVEIKTDSHGFVDRFDYTVDNVTHHYKPDEVLHFKRFHPLNDHYGSSPALSLALAIESDFFMLGYQRDFFKNSAVPRILVMSQYHMNEKARNRFIEHWKQRYQGVGKMFGMSLLEGGKFEVKDLATNMRDAEYAEGRKENRKAFQTRIGVPGGILGEPGANYANLRKHNEAFWLNTVWVQIQFIIDQFNAWERAEKENVVARPYIWGHLQMQQVILERIKDITTVSKDGVMTINEIRAAYGLPPVEWGDEWVQPSNLYGGNAQNNSEPDTEESDGSKPESNSPSGGPGDKSSQPSKVKNYHSKSSDATPALSSKDERYEYRRAKWKAFDKRAQKNADKWVKKFQPAFVQQRDKVLSVIADIDLPTAKKYHDAAMTKLEGGHVTKLYNLISRKAKDDDYDEWLEDYLDELMDIDLEIELFEDMAHEEYLEMLDEYGSLGMDEAGDIGGTFDLSDKYAVEYVKEKEVKFATEVNQTTREQLRGLLIESIDAGSDAATITLGVKEIFEQVDNLDPARARRARTIARTEVQSAANKGQLEGYYQAGVEKKEWVTSGDSDVRDIHDAIDGEIANLREPFSNGLMQPGDVNGPAEEVINCRCSIAPVV